MTTRTQTQFDKEDIRRAAYSMIGNHGRSAAQVAGQRANNLRGDDVKESRMMWERIAKTINTLQRPVAAPARRH